MIKKISKVLLTIGFFCFFAIITSCKLSKSDDEIIEEMGNNLISLLENEDKDGFVSLFAPAKIKDLTNFDSSLDEIMEYYDGKFVSEKHPGAGTFKEKDGEYQAKWFNLSFDIITDMNEYRIAIYWCTEYSTDSNYLGIWSLYIINENDYLTPEYSYAGDGLWTPGINIGKVYVEDK